jgi:hypothetical protein
VTALRQLLGIADDGSIAGGALRLARDTFTGALDPTGSFAELVDGTYRGASIVIAQARANPLGAADAPVVVTGTGDVLAQKTLPVTVTLTQLASGQVVARLQYTLPTDSAGRARWRFGDDLPDLPTVVDYSAPSGVSSPLDGLLLFHPTYTAVNLAQTVDGVALAAGLNVQATMMPSGILGAFATIAGTGPLALVGTVVVPVAPSVITPLVPGQFPWDLTPAPPGVTLRAALFTGPVGLGQTATFADGALRLYSPPSNAWAAQNPTFSPLSGVSTTLALPALGTTIDVTALTYDGTDGARLVATFPGHGLGNLGDLVDLLGAQDVAGQLPSSLRAAAGGLGSLTLTRLEATIAAEAGALTLASAAMTVAAPDLRWQLGGSFAEVDGVALDLAIDHPFGPQPQLDVAVRGALVFEGVPCVIEAHLIEDFRLSVRLASPQTLPLAKLVGDHLPGVTPPSDLTIDDLALTVAPGNYYAMSATMADQPNPWTVPVGRGGLTFTDVTLYALVPTTGGWSGSFSARAQLGGLTLTAAYQVPGDFQLSARYPAIKLSQMIAAVTDLPLTLPGGFDLEFDDSYVLITQQGPRFAFALGTTVAQFGSLAFVAEESGGWGFAAGIAVSKDRVDQLAGVGSFVSAFDDWFPFDDLVLAVSSISDPGFTFPGFQQFRAPALGTTKIQLPAIASGVSRGLYLYTTTTFTRKNKILGALIDLIGIPENTALTCMFAYLADQSAFQLGVSLTTFITPDPDPAKRSCQGPAGYANGCLTGMLFVQVGGADGFTFGLAATLKTTIQDSPVDFSVLIAVATNGIFVSGTMNNQRPLAFGPLQLAGVAVELGISYEGVPSFGFAAELDVAGAFDSSIAVLVDTSNPAKSMIAGALSDLTLRQVVDALAGGSDPLPAPLEDVLGQIGISGTADGAFTIPATGAAAVAAALDGYDAATVSSAFATYGQVADLPASSTGLTVFVDTPGARWYLTAKTGGGASSAITHYEVSRADDGSLAVAKEAQFYFVPDPAGSQIGTFFYPAGMMVAGRLRFLFIDLDVDVEIAVTRGVKVEAFLAPIQLVSPSFFSITAATGASGARVSICTYAQPAAPAGERAPHFLIDGQLTVLGLHRSLYASVDAHGLAVALSGDLIPAVMTGSLGGTFTGSTGLDLTGQLTVGIGAVDLGPLGTYHVDTGVTAGAHVFANATAVGAAFTCGFELGGHTFDLGTLCLDVSTEVLADLAGKLLRAVEDALRKAFTDAPKLFADLARTLLNWADNAISAVLTGVLGVPAGDVAAILGALPAVCSATTAASLL